MNKKETNRNRCSIGREALLHDVAEMHQHSHSLRSRYVSRAVLKNYETFLGHEPTTADITERCIIDFSSYLAEHVAASTARTYLHKLHAIVEECVERHYIERNPIPPIRKLIAHVPASPRTFLTSDEVRQLSETDCKHQDVKLAFLFACCTGLRLSDIETLRWEHLCCSSSGRTLVKVQEKTRHEVRVPLGASACSILHQAGDGASGQVFHLPSRSTISLTLREWGQSAAIGKRLTFHVSRHSFATMLISADVGIFTVSKLCGHTNVRTTQIYAHMLDTTLRDGIRGLDRLLGDVRIQ